MALRTHFGVRFRRSADAALEAELAELESKPRTAKEVRDACVRHGIAAALLIDGEIHGWFWPNGAFSTSEPSARQ